MFVVVAATFGGLGLQRAVDRRGLVLHDLFGAADAAVVGDHDFSSVLVQHADAAADEHVAGLNEDERLRPLADNRIGRQDEGIDASPPGASVRAFSTGTRSRTRWPGRNRQAR